MHTDGLFYVQFGATDLPPHALLNWRASDQPGLTVYYNKSGYSLTPTFAAGDFDGDGVDDLALIGDDFWYSGGRGAVYLLQGPLPNTPGQVRDLATTPADLTINAPGGTGYYFGSAATMADLNGDGADDLVVGSPMLATPSSRGSVAVLYGRAIAAPPAVWDLAADPADVVIQTGADSRFQYLGAPLHVGDYNDDELADLLVGDRLFNPNMSGALFILDHAGFAKEQTIDLTATPADRTFVGCNDPISYGQTFSDLDLAGPTASDGTSLWFSDRDASYNAQSSGEVWRLSDLHLLDAGDVVQLSAITPVELYYGQAETGFGYSLLVDDFDDNDLRDLAVCANYLALPGDGGKVRGAVYVFLDQMEPPPAPPVDDDTIDDDTAPTDDDTAPTDDDDTVDDDDDDDDDDDGCGCQV